MCAARAAPTVFEAEGRWLHEPIARGARVEYVPQDDRGAWQWLAPQQAPVTGLPPCFVCRTTPHFQAVIRRLLALTRSSTGQRTSDFAQHVRRSFDGE